MRKLLPILVIVISQVTILSGQLKYEREYRLDKSQVPEQALQFVEALKLNSKVKWYKEENLKTNSIEAKTKYQSQKYSIEFDTSGIIEDIEIEIPWPAILPDPRTAILQYFEANFDKHKIYKVQQQFSGNAASLLQIPSSQPIQSTDDILLRYEIVAKVKRQKNYQKLELLFSDKGELIQQSIILLKNTDNLEY